MAIQAAVYILLNNCVLYIRAREEEAHAINMSLQITKARIFLS